jgi:arsenite/tail-anchored protein-transporting ATPase
VRILVYTGKGGVGKTSVAAATALRCAELGYRTVVLSTDLAHSLADSLDTTLGPEPSLVANNLWAQETDIYNNLQTHWGVVQEWLNAILRWSGEVDSLVADELTVLPGMDELANLLWINRHRESGRFDVIIVDAAPTGETLRLLSFPDVMRWWMQRIFPIQRRAMGLARPLIGTFIDMPLPSDKVYDSVERLFAQLDKLHAMLVDRTLTSVRLVLNPEKMVVSEAQRTSTYFHLFGYPMDLVVANRVLPGEVSDHYFQHWKETQTRYLKRVEEGFSPVPIKQVPLFEDEVVGLDRLRQMAHSLYQQDDPSQIYYSGSSQVLEGLADGGFRLTIPLPFATKGEVHLRQTGDELFVHVGAHRRHVILPRALVGLSATRAKLDEPNAVLTVDFRQPSSSA